MNILLCDEFKIFDFKDFHHIESEIVNQL
jgi:hypothetical protein